MGTTRLDWIDWMKTIGIYLIVLGHFFPIGDKYIYAFNVPLFFLISGFLSKKESDNKVFWKKLFYNLIVPMLIITFINFLYDCCIALLNGNFEFNTAFIWGIKLMLGFHSSLANCWFIYTLIILKIIHHFLFKLSNKFFYVFILISIIVAYISNTYYTNILTSSNSIINTITAFPFFAIGVYAQKYKQNFNTLSNKALLLIGGGGHNLSWNLWYIK